MQSKVAINEIFYSFQGESSLVGVPTVFIRTYGCNLNCKICDTKYSFEGICKKLTLNEIIKIVSKIKTPYICITGGEPLLQKNEIIKLTNELLNLDKNISIETNGSLDISGFNKFVKIIMDIKTPSIFDDYDFNKVFNTNNIKHLTSNDEVKFVISNENDYEFAKNIISKYKLLNVNKVLFSPNLEINNLSNDLVNWILKDQINVMFQPQLHKLIKEKPIYFI